MRTGSQTTGAALAAGAAVVLLVSMFLDWYEGDLPEPAQGRVDAPTYNAFEALERSDVALVLAGVAAIVIAGVLVARLMSESPLPGLALLGVGLFAVAVVIYRGLNSPDKPFFGGTVLEVEPKVGWYIGLASAALIAVGGLLAYLAGPRLELEGVEPEGEGAPSAGEGAPSGQTPEAKDLP